MSELIEKKLTDEQTTINIFGACVSRDLFPKNTEYVIQQYVSFTSPASLFLPKSDSELTMDDLSCLNWGSNFAKRCMMLDYNKTSLDYLFQKESDFLLLDFADVRMKMEKDGRNGHFTKTNLHVKMRSSSRNFSMGVRLREFPHWKRLKNAYPDFAKKY